MSSSSSAYFSLALTEYDRNRLAFLEKAARSAMVCGDRPTFACWLIKVAMSGPTRNAVLLGRVNQAQIVKRLDVIIGEGLARKGGLHWGGGAFGRTDAGQRVGAIAVHPRAGVERRAEGDLAGMALARWGTGAGTQTALEERGLVGPERRQRRNQEPLALWSRA